MSLQSNLSTLITSIGTTTKNVRTSISGSGTNDAAAVAAALDTTAGNCVDAINEVKATADSAVGGGVTSVNGQSGPGAVTITTADISEVTNLYYTDARVIAAPLTAYSAGAGTVSATDTVIAGLQKLDGNISALTTTGVAEGTKNLYYTDTRAIAAPLTGYTAGVGTVVATDTVIQALQKIDANVQAIDHTDLIDDVTPSATTTYSSNKIDSDISTAVSALVDSSPAALDTLNELAAAIGDDSSFATTMTNALALKATIADTYSVTELGATVDTNDWAAEWAAAIA